MLLWRWGEASGGNTIDPFNPQNPSVDFLQIILNFILFSSAGVIHTANEPTTTLRTSHVGHASLHPQSFNPEGSKKLPFAVGGSGVGAGRGTHRWEWRRKRRSISEFSRAAPVTLKPVHDHMEPHGSGEGGRAGGRNRIWEAASWLTEGRIAEVQVSCPSSASSSQRYHASNSNSRLWWTPPEWRAASGWWRGCFNSEPTAIISLCCTHRMPDLLLSIDRAHFSGRGGGRRHRRFTSTCDWCVKHRVVELRSRTLTFFFGNKCFCLYIFEWVIKNLWHTSTKCFPTFIFSDESRTAAPIKHLGKKQTH